MTDSLDLRSAVE